MVAIGPDEHPILYVHKHWFYFFLPALSILAYIGILWLPYRILNYCNDEFVITDKKIHLSHGIFSKNTVSIPLDKINDIQCSQGFFGRILGFGTIHIQSAANNIGHGFSYIANPENVKAVIENALVNKEDSHDKRLAGYIGDAVRK